MKVEALLAPCVFQCAAQDIVSYKNMVKRISCFLDSVERFDFVVPIIPRDIFDEIMGQWPYNADKSQKIDNQRIDPYALILAFTDNRLQKPKYNYSAMSNSFCCIQSEISNRWLGFINSWKEISNKSKGVYPTDNCSVDEIEGIQVVHEQKTWRLLAFPWLEKTDIKLPVEGDAPYIPPKNWNRLKLKQMIKIHGEMNYGYIDINHDIWVWDKMHNNHWDV